MITDNSSVQMTQLGRIIEESALALVLADPESFQIVHATHGARQRLGYNTLGELTQRRLTDIWPEFTEMSLGELTAPLLVDKKAFSFETIQQRKDGATYPAKVQLELAKGAPPALVVWLQDITESKKAEAEHAFMRSRAEAAEARFRELLESAPDAMVITDIDGRIVMINRMTEKLFGYRRNELIGQPVEVLIPERFRDRHIHDRQEYSRCPVVRPMGTRKADLLGRHRGGREFFVEISLSPMKSDGQWLMVGAIRDISERKQAEHALEQQARWLERSNAELEQFAYVASHDLQEPLRMVASYVQLLARRYQGKLDAEADEFIGFAVEGAVRMRNLIDDLLAYSRITRVDKPFEPVDCEVVLQNVLLGLKATIDESGAVITHDPLPQLMSDGMQLEQLFQNCITNAIKFQDKIPPCIHVSAKKHDGEWIIGFKDNGIGIEPRYFERIFSVFQRLHGRARYPGTGIGLAICKKIIEHHNGRVWVDSEPGKGTVFYFAFPAEETPPFSGKP